MLLRVVKYGSLKALVLAAALFAIPAACRKKEEKKKDPAPVFDKQAMLVNYADNLVIPAFAALKKDVQEMRSAWLAFSASPDTAGLNKLRAGFFTAYSSYQNAGIFGFGPGEDKGIRINFNIFPSDTARIESNIASGSYDLSTAANISAKGFPALEYLFFGYGHSRETIAGRFAASAARVAYADKLVNELETLSSQIADAWSSGYRNTFVSSLGTDVGSSIGFLINQLNYELDYLKNAKLATPVGLRSAGAVQPDDAEAFYSGRSMELARMTFGAIENVYLGRGTSGANGPGFDDYIIHLKSSHVNGPLHDAIVSQFSVARAKLAAVPDPLSSAVVNNKAAVEDAYKELVRLLALLKTDLPSSLGVVITYQDGDGD